MEPWSKNSYVVTGAAGGVGRAVVERLVERGASVVACDHGLDLRGESTEPGRVADALADLIATGRVVLDDADVRAPETAAQLVERARGLGAFSGLVHAAGTLRDASLARLPDADLEEALSVSVTASFRLVREASRAWVSEGRPGSVVLLSSPSAFFGVSQKSASLAASAALVGLCRTAALELRKHKVRVNVVAPTARTRMTEDTPYFQSIRPDSMSPKPVARLVSFLLSDAAHDVSGEWLGSAGGRVYGLTIRETTGAFLGPDHDEDAIGRALAEALRA